MIKLIDKYIIKKFLSTFFFMLGIIMLLSMVFDMSSRLSEFIEKQAPLSAIITQYYFTFLLHYGNMFSSLIIFVSVIWFTAKMAQDSEIIPIMNSGINFRRLLRPYMIASTLLMIIALFLNHIVLPRSNKVMLEFEETYYRSRMHIENYHAELPNNLALNFSSYSSDDNVVSNFVMERTDSNNDLVHFLKAKSAVNKIGTNTWTLSNYYERKIIDSTETIYNGLKKDTVFSFKIEDLAQRDNIAETMTYSELKSFIEKEKAKGSPNIPLYEIVLYERTSLPFSTYVLTIIGVSVSSRRKRGGVGINIALGLGIIFIYIFAMKVTTVAAINLGLSTSFAVWVPNILFGVVAYILYRYAPK
jgi:lipopolysaccharide export system permease protein